VCQATQRRQIGVVDLENGDSAIGALIVPSAGDLPKRANGGVQSLSCPTGRFSYWWREGSTA
jgi:hypothetical protein